MVNIELLWYLYESKAYQYFFTSFMMNFFLIFFDCRMHMFWWIHHDCKIHGGECSQSNVIKIHHNVLLAIFSENFLVTLCTQLALWYDKVWWYNMLILLAILCNPNNTVWHILIELLCWCSPAYNLQQYCYIHQ